MYINTLSKEDRERILKAIEENKEFRYALMGLLGYREVLDHITSLEERFAKLEERFAKLEERVAKLEERVVRVEEEMRENRGLLTVIAHRFGILSEEGLRSSLKYVVEEVFGVAKVGKWIYRDDEGFVYGYPTTVEIDVVIRDKEHILIEIKSRVSKGDIAEISKIGKLYEKVERVKPKLVIIGGFIDEDVYDLAKNLDVEIRPAVRI
jgi:hypothetical protein